MQQCLHNTDVVQVQTSWPALPSTLDGSDFKITLNDGTIAPAISAMVMPNFEYNERSVLILNGEFGNRLPKSDPAVKYPAKVEIVADATPLQLVGPHGRLVSAVGMSMTNDKTPYDTQPADPNGGGPTTQANSTMVAVNPKTLEVYDSVLLPEMMATPHTITMFHGKIAIYMAGSVPGLSKLYRYFWDPKTKKLSQDTTFVVTILAPHQTPGDAPSIIGNWVLTQTNGTPAGVPSSIVAVNQSNPAWITSIVPFGLIPTGGHSWAPPKAAADAENNMIYSDDQGVGKIAGIKFARKTGALTTAWVADAMTTCLQGLYGPANKRVLGTSRYNPDSTAEQVQEGTYTEQATWRDAATGRILAESDFFAPMATNTIITPTFGGGFYVPTNTGFMILKVEPAK